MTKEFSCDGNKGFSLPLPNGYSVSIQFGPGAYCEHYNSNLRFDKPMQKRGWRSGNAETAIFTPDGDFLEYKGDDVQGYQTVEEVFETIMYASNLPAINQLKV